MHTHRYQPSRNQFSLERLEPRALLSATPITFDPNGTLIKGGVGTINGVKYIELGRGSSGGNINGIPTGGGHGPSRALVFATDLDNDGIVDADEITGIAVSAAARMTIFGNVNGDIVTNLRSNNDLSGDAGDGSTLLNNNVKEITVHGSVFGNIIAGHSLNKIKIDGSVENLLVGTASNGMSFHFHGSDGAAVAFSAFDRGTNGGGGSISGVTIGTGVVGIHAGDGGPSGDGGNVEKVLIKNDTSGLIIQAGDGGDDNDRSGGEGGRVFGVKVSSSEGVTIIAGHGGDSTNASALGGIGGSVIGAQINAVGPVVLTAGDGGSNTATNSHGGDGGDVLNCKVGGSDISATAGDGGDGAVLGGEGGSVSSIKGTISGEGNFAAGHGGASSADAGNGGDVNAVKFLSGGVNAFIRMIVAGDGGDGTIKNGSGGSISGVNFDGDVGSFTSAYGVSSMGGLFAGLAGTVPGGKGANGAVTGINAGRIAAIVAGTGDAPQAARLISGIKATEIGANFDTDSDNKGVNEPAFDYFESIAPDNQFNLGEMPIDGLVLGIKIGSLSTRPLFKFETSTGTQVGDLDPHTVP